jgi:hypothetical protein
MRTVLVQTHVKRRMSPTEGGSEMNRSSGAGLIGLGIVMAVVGAILDYAVSVTAKGFNINTIGVILLVVGIVAAVIGLLIVLMGGSSSSSTVEQTRNTAGGGQERVVESQDSGFGS